MPREEEVMLRLLRLVAVFNFKHLSFIFFAGFAGNCVGISQ